MVYATHRVHTPLLDIAAHGLASNTDQRGGFGDAVMLLDRTGERASFFIHSQRYRAHR